MTDSELDRLVGLYMAGGRSPAAEDRIYAAIGLRGPGAAMVVQGEPADGPREVMVWRSESESEGDDGSRAVYRESASERTIAVLRGLQWITVV